MSSISNLDVCDLQIPDHFKSVRRLQPMMTKSELVQFEQLVKVEYEKGLIKGPIHLSGGNEDPLIEIFQYINRSDWVFTSWRNHYHALLHGVSKKALWELILSGKSMSVHSRHPRLYSSSIVGGIVPIALGVAKAIKMRGLDERVWLFCGDMTYETGGFHEAYKYSRRHGLPLEIVVEDNNMSTNTPTDMTWNGAKTPPCSDIFYYRYERIYPHHGTGTWVLF